MRDKELLNANTKGPK